ncbi:MAG: helix-turn-helix transcriptional regulator [bacterium]
MKKNINIYTLLGKRIQYERKRKGLSQEKLAEKANTSTNYIWHIEKGLKKPSLQTLKKIADVFEMPLNNLFEESSVPFQRDKIDSQIITLLKNKSFLYKKKILKIIKVLG